MNSLKCFVAMALGRSDTDKVYKAMIAPVLREAGIRPIRIDKIDFIDDIDDRIITELRGCDFALADLTYARPSVYFEAGFAQRVVPVMYTCRRDHLHPTSGNAHGNLRVHFDLQMKNIVSWSSPTDSTFKKRLARRLSQALAPLLRANKDQDRRQQATRAFKALSPQKQLSCVTGIARSELRNAGFHVRRPEFPWSTWVGFKLEGDCLHLAAVRVNPRILREELAEVVAIARLNWVGELRKWLDARRLSKVRRVTERLIFCTLGKVPHSRASEALPTFALDSSLGAYVRRQFLMLELGLSRPADVQVHFVGGIESGPSLQSELRRRLAAATAR